VFAKLRAPIADRLLSKAAPTSVGAVLSRPEQTLAAVPAEREGLYVPLSPSPC
jgi:hypothetical protein